MLITAAEFHHVRSPQEYRQLIEMAMAKRRAHGFPESASVEVPTPITAYVDHGRWLIDCECGAANMVQPDWILAGCLACGAIHSHVVIPSDRSEGEAVLNARPREIQRNWWIHRGETVEQLQADNLARNVKGGR